MKKLILIILILVSMFACVSTILEHNSSISDERANYIFQQYKASFDPVSFRNTKDVSIETCKGALVSYCSEHPGSPDCSPDSDLRTCDYTVSHIGNGCIHGANIWMDGDRVSSIKAVEETICE